MYLIPSIASWDSGYHWAFITSSFLHFHWLHALLNLRFLWYFGPIVEGVVGPKRFFLYYLLSATSAGLISWLGNVKLEGNDWAGAGASGPLFGLIGILLALKLRWGMFHGPNEKQLAKTATLILVGGFLLKLTPYDIIDNWGHLGGLFGGFCLAWFSPRPQGH